MATMFLRTENFVLKQYVLFLFGRHETLEERIAVSVWVHDHDRNRTTYEDVGV
jgi:hypothetical protein